MRRLLFTSGFALSLAVAASSFATLINNEERGTATSSQQSFFMPKNNSASIDECLADHDGCGQAAAASVCESNGFSRVVAFGAAAPEDMTGSITPSERTLLKIAAKKDVPLLVTCAR